jgi:hypothetical protein
MTKPTVDQKRTLIGRLTASTLFLSATALGISALFAAAPDDVQRHWHPKPRGQCFDWFKSLKNNQAQKDNIAQAFTAALVRSATDDDYRNNVLLNDDPDVVKKAIEDLVKADPGPKPAFPGPHTIVFYYPENDDFRSPPPLRPQKAGWPDEHCLHILNLPKPVKATAANPHPKINADFHHNLQCCYIPW